MFSTQHTEEKSLPILIIMGLLIAASSVAAFVADKKHVAENCKDVRIAMDGSYSAVVEKGGLSPSSQLTIYQEFNRKRIWVGKVPVAEQKNSEGHATYVGDKLKLVIHDKKQKDSGRTIASLQGEIKGQKVSATLSCAN